MVTIFGIINGQQTDHSFPVSLLNFLKNSKTGFNQFFAVKKNHYKYIQYKNKSLLSIDKQNSLFSRFLIVFGALLPMKHFVSLYRSSIVKVMYNFHYSSIQALALLP